MPSNKPDPDAISEATALDLLQELLALEDRDIKQVNIVINVLDDEELSRLSVIFSRVRRHISQIKYKRTVQGYAAYQKAKESRHKKQPIGDITIPIFKNL